MERNRESMPQQLRFIRPGSLEEALEVLSEGGGKARALAGGTDLLVDMRAGLSAPETVVDIKAVASLHELAYDPKQGLSIGACVTVNELLEDQAVRSHFRILEIAAGELATHALRNRATVVGNLVTASPCGDMASPLLCLGAQVVIRSRAGTRTLGLADFIQGVKRTVLEPGEIVERVQVPTDMQDAAAGYKKLKRIKGHDLGVVAVAMIRKGDLVRVAISSAAPTPVLLPDFAAGAKVAEIQEAAWKAISPIDDVRCTKEYRAFMVGEFVERLMRELAGDGQRMRRGTR